jgi:hypothetical protein
MALKKVLADTPLTLPSNQGPVWKGPSVDGISQTLLSRYLSCAERFRVSAIDGLQVTPTFNNRLEFGNMWHAAEEAFAEHGNAPSQKNPAQPAWQRSLLDYGNELGARYPTQLMQIVHWLTVTEALFPAYIAYWSKHPDTLNRTPLLQEERFAVPYKLPSGRTALLRGKWDSVDLVSNLAIKAGDTYYNSAGEKKVASAYYAKQMKGVGSVNDGIWLMENKTKSVIDVQKINRQLRFDLQSMLYLVALTQVIENEDPDTEVGERFQFPTKNIKGVRYNVIKRSTHKTADSMMKKVNEDIRDGRAGEWFSRWNVEIDSRDLQVFKTKALDPILDNLLDDYEWWKWCYENKGKTLGRDNAKTGERAFPIGNLYDNESRRIRFPHHQRRHFIMPYIGYNPLSEGGESDLDNYLFTGSEIGLQRVDTLFPELA